MLAIVGVIAAMAAPRYTDALSRYRMDLAARRIADDLSLAQSRARSSSSSRTITFSVDTNSYQLPLERDLNLASSSYSVRLADDPYCVTLTKVNVGINGGPNVKTLSITFNGYGVPSTAATIAINCGSYQRKVLIDGDSGTTSIQ